MYLDGIMWRAGVPRQDASFLHTSVTKNDSNRREIVVYCR